MYVIVYKERISRLRHVVGPFTSVEAAHEYRKLHVRATALEILPLDNPKEG